MYTSLPVLISSTNQSCKQVARAACPYSNVFLSCLSHILKHKCSLCKYAEIEVYQPEQRDYTLMMGSVQSGNLLLHIIRNPSGTLPFSDYQEEPSSHCANPLFLAGFSLWDMMLLHHPAANQLSPHVSTYELNKRAQQLLNCGSIHRSTKTLLFNIGIRRKILCTLWHTL